MKKFRRGEWLIYISKTKYKVKKNGATIKSLSPLDGLQKYLSQALPQLFT